MLSVGTVAVMILASWAVISPSQDRIDGAFAPREWREPVSENGATATPMSTARYAVDFTPMEEALARLSLDAGGNKLQLDSTTADVLEALTNWATVHELTPEEEQRALRLARAILPSDQAVTHYDNLWTSYREYKSFVTRLNDASNGQPTSDRQEEILRAQKSLFGPDAAQALFGEQNAISAFLVAQEKIMNDDTLSAAERREALNSLRRKQQDGANGPQVAQ